MSWTMTLSPISAGVLVIFLGYYLSFPRLETRVDRFFVTLLYVQLTTLILDVCATLMISNPTYFAPALISFINMLYFAGFVMRSFAFLSVVTEFVRHKLFKLFNLAALAFTVSEVIVVLSPFTGWVYSISETGAYSSGPLYCMLYCVLYFFIFLSLVIIIRRRRTLSHDEMVGALACQLMLILGGVVRFLFPTVVVMNMFCTLGIVILCLTFEDPNRHFDTKLRVFNRTALSVYIEEFVVREKRFGFGVASITNYNDMRDIYGTELMNEAMHGICEFLLQAGRTCKVFYLDDGCFAAVVKGRPLDNTQQAAIRERFERPWKAGTTEISLGVQCAVLAGGVEVRSGDDLVSAAKSVLSRNAQSGFRGDGFITCEDMEAARRLVDVKHALLNAVGNDGIDVYFQPVISTEDMKVVGAEALARMVDSRLGVVSPGEFIPIAERSGAITQLGEQVMRKACESYMQHGFSCLGIRSINVNLSPIQCMRPTIAQEVSDIVSAAHMDPAKVRIEVTEESKIEQDVLKDRMAEMIARGFTFALDDYGCGFSNTLRVKRLPFSNVKLDMEIVWEHLKAPDDILPSEVRAFRDLGMSVTSEGVETAEMARGLRAMGCTYLQGFYFAKPMPLDEFVAFVREWNAADHSDLL